MDRDRGVYSPIGGYVLLQTSLCGCKRHPPPCNFAVVTLSLTVFYKVHFISKYNQIIITWTVKASLVKVWQVWPTVGGAWQPVIVVNRYYPAPRVLL